MVLKFPPQRSRTSYEARYFYRLQNEGKLGKVVSFLPPGRATPKEETPSHLLLRTLPAPKPITG
jgi:hypothetical protein